MEVLERFKNFVASEKLCNPTENRILLAVSGGRDSVLMMHLFVKAGYRCGIAHCHFGLRGREADLDEALVMDYARELGLPVYVRHFDTKSYAEKKGISIQMAARELRYDWFEELANQLRFDRIAVAHHATDQVETILINQIRGTGIRGMQGMRPRRGLIIRPLLFLQVTDVVEAVRHFGLAYRDDLTNFSTDYLRNRLRLEVLPILRDMHPGLEQTFTRNAEAAQQVSQFLESQVAYYQRQWISQREKHAVLRLVELRRHPSAELLIYELLQPYGFSGAVSSDISRTLTQQNETDSLHVPAGQQFHSPSHVLLLNREEAIIRPRSELSQTVQTRIEISPEHPQAHWAGQQIQASFADIQDFDRNIFSDPASHHKAFFDADRVSFPLRVRSWQEGDRFQPFGMDGKNKKISDLFTGLKIGLWEKENVPIIEDAAGVILWVAPFRQSWEYNICDKTLNVLTLSYFCEDLDR